MWLKGIRIKNIKCFDDTADDLIFTKNRTRKSDKPFRWITLLGENGTGKTTLLQTMGLLLAGAEAAKELLPRPDGWVRDNSSYGELTAYIHKEDDDIGKYGEGKQRERRNFYYSYIVTGNKPVEVPTSGIYTVPVLLDKASKQLRWFRSNAFAPNSEGWFAVGYGAFRRLTREHRILIPSLSLPPPNRASNFLTQFNDDEPISSFERWLVYLEDRIAKDPQDKSAKKMRELGETTITKLLPGNVTIHEVTKNGLILFNLNGQIVPTIGMSDGFRSIIALAGDLVWRLLQTFPNIDDPTQASGVVLIDELDIHLHPIWQRDIAGWLQNSFPNLQFIVATHSPLIAIGAGEEALTLKLTMDDNNSTVNISQMDDISAYDVDHVLQNPAFGLVSTHSPQAQAKIERYHQLNSSFDELEPAEQREYHELSNFMRQAMPIGIPSPGSLEPELDKLIKR